MLLKLLGKDTIILDKYAVRNLLKRINKRRFNHGV